MFINGISIDGFGMLSKSSLPDLSAGLNVIHGRNGSGKTTILHFLRGVLCGFGEARRLHLLPPLKGGNPGGSLNVDWEKGKYEVIRHHRSDRSDLLAVNVREGQLAEVAGLRTFINGIDADRLQTVFAVSNVESHALESLLRVARQDGIDLQSRRDEAGWLSEKVEQVRHERLGLFQAEPASRGRIAELERRKEEVQRSVDSISSEHEARQTRWAREVQGLRQEIERLQREADWLLAELGLAQTDRDEVHDRLWSTRQEVRREEQTVATPVVSTTPKWMDEVHDLDRQIAHAQQVLRDLAASRMEITVEKSRRVGAETPDTEAFFVRHRRALRALEMQAQRLDALGDRLQSSREAGECICGGTATTLDETVDSIRTQLYLICQELSRQESAHEQLLLHSQRDDVDRCELELTRQIQRWRLRRDELLHRDERTLAETLQHRAQVEVGHCGCGEHDAYVNSLPTTEHRVAAIPQTIVREQIVTLPNARPGDGELALQLVDRVRQLCAQYQQACGKLRDARQQLSQLEAQASTFASDRTLQERRYEFVVIEQQLADAREQWQSLALLQQILQRTCDSLKREVQSPVLEEASGLLKRLTEGRYVAFRATKHAEELRIVNDAQAEVSPASLSRGTLDQAALSLRLALCSEYARRGIRFPLVLDDVLADSDEARLRIACEVLRERGAAGQQILFLTCQDRLARMFQSQGVNVRYLTEPVIEATNETVRLETPRGLRTQTTTLVERPVNRVVSHAFPPEQEVRRIQPEAPFWLEVTSSLSYVPSISSQMARRLGALGIRNVADLIELDAAMPDTPLEGLQVSREQVRTWQAEGRLLCCVPNLTGRDAQLLVAAGVDSPEQLRETDADGLLRNIDRVRRERGELQEYAWLGEGVPGRERESAAQWISSAGRARTFEQALQWAGVRQAQGLTERRRRRRNERRRQMTNGARASHRRVDGSRSRRSESGLAVMDVVRETRLETSPQGATTWKFYLNQESPLVDAPSIGPRTAERMAHIGIRTVAQFVSQPAAQIAALLDARHLNEATIQAWQQQSLLMCAVPELRGHDAQLLVACGITSATELGDYAPEKLLGIVGPFAASKEGQRLLRSAKAPDLDEVTHWIHWARHSRGSSAA